jgi:hypothetical protein
MATVPASWNWVTSKHLRAWDAPHALVYILKHNMMKPLIATIILTLLGANLYAQTNILEQLQVPDMLNIISWEEHGDHYYFATKEEAGPINTALRHRASRFSLNKYNKNTHQLVASVYLAGDTLQNDSLISAIYMVMRGKYIHINYSVQQIANNENGRVVHNHYVKLDTSLNVIVPDVALPQIAGWISSGGFATKDDGGCIMGYYTAPGVIGMTSKYLVLDSLGNVTGNDTLGAVNYMGYHPTVWLRELVELPDHNYIATASGITGSFLFGFVVYNADMQLLDTFNFKQGLETNPEAYTANYHPPRMIGLPSGSLISANNDHILYGDPSGAFAKIIKHTAATRYGIDDYIAFGPVDNTDTAHGNYSAIRTITYNPVDNNLYYASITHMTVDGSSCTSNSDKSYLEIISVDTNLNFRWKKYIKMTGECSSMGVVSVPDGRAGILVAGHSYQDVDLDKDWVYYINDNTPSDNPTDITDITLKQDDGFVLYPNPADNEIHLVSDKDLKEASLYDLSGRFILSKPIASGKATLKIDQLSPGIYLIKATDKGGRVYQKKIVKK